MMTKPSTRLLKLLKPPSQIANSLDWKKQTKATVATLHIGKHHIGVAIAEHPANNQEVQALYPVRLDLVTTAKNQRSVAPASVDRLERICDTHHVGSFLCYWPLQKEGRAGAPCGKVLHTLESLITASDAVLTPNRPICLWTGGDNDTDADDDKRYVMEQYVEDEWGRAAVYSRCSYSKTIHLASKENYCYLEGSSEAAADTWKDFSRQFWPPRKLEQLRRKEQQRSRQQRERATVVDLDDDMDDNHDGDDDDGYSTGQVRQVRIRSMPSSSSSSFGAGEGIAGLLYPLICMRLM